MKVGEMQKNLDEANVPRELYGFVDALNDNIIDELDDDKIIINRIKKNKWEVFYIERGIKTERKVFCNEERACNYMYTRLVEYSDFLKKQNNK